MGVYLSSPITEKISEDNQCDLFTYGASSMQGWRMTQEDSHNCLPDFDTGTRTSLFAVYDGHGGSEVAKYCSAKLPDYIKGVEQYKKNNLSECLQDAFLGFDETLTHDDVISELKVIAGDDEGDEEEETDAIAVRKEADILYEEASMPIEELRAKYSGNPLLQQNKHLKGQKQPSPMIRAKRSRHMAGEADSVKGELDLKDGDEHPDNDNNLNTEKEMKETNSVKSESDQDVKLVKPDVNDNDKCEAAVSSSSEPNEDVENNVNKSVNDTDKSDSIEVSNNTVSTSSADNNLPGSKSAESSSSSSAAASSTLSSSGSSGQSSEAASSSSSSGSGDAAGDAPSSTSSAGTSQQGGSSSGVESEPSGSGEPGSSGTPDYLVNQARQQVVCHRRGLAMLRVMHRRVRVQQVQVNKVAQVLEWNQNHQGQESLALQGEAASSSSTSGSGDAVGDAPSSTSSAGTSQQGGSSSRVESEPSGSGEPGSSGVSGSSGKKSGLTLDDIDSEDDDSSDEDEAYNSEDYEDVDDDDSDDDDDDDDDEIGGSGIFGYVKNNDEDDDGPDEEPGSGSGCTAVVALLRDKQLVVANAGDSRCVLCRDGKAIDLSVDHKPEDKPEKDRIEAAGGQVTEDGRVNGGLNLSRAIGDHYYKKNISIEAKDQMISAFPDIECATLEDKDEFMVLACDGIWNYMTSQEVVDYVRERLKDENKLNKPSLICEEMFDHCLAPNTSGDGTGCDNMTCIIVVFKQNHCNNKKHDLDSSGVSEPPEKRQKTEEEVKS